MFYGYNFIMCSSESPGLFVLKETRICFDLIICYITNKQLYLNSKKEGFCANTGN